MNIKRFSKIIFNIVIITITLFITTNIVNAENTISTSIDKQINITQISVIILYAVYFSPIQPSDN